MIDTGHLKMQRFWINVYNGDVFNSIVAMAIDTAALRPSWFNHDNLGRLITRHLEQ